MADFKMGWDKLRKFLSASHTWIGNQIFSNITITGGSATGLTSVSTGTLGATGLSTLTGGITTGTPTSHSATEAATTATLYGHVHLVTGAYTITIPALSVGQSATFIATTAAVFSLDSTSPNYFVLAGTALDAGDKITSAGSAGATVTIYCTATNVIRVLWTNSTFIDGGA